MYGTVTKYDYHKGYGFIKADNGEYYFIHHSNLNDEYLEPGYYVFFKGFMNDKSDRNARNVIVIEVDGRNRA